MTVIFAQNGLFIMSLIAMYLFNILPGIIIFAAIVAVAGGGREGAGRGLRFSRALFHKTFNVLALVSGAAVLAACIWGAQNLGGR